MRQEQNQVRATGARAESEVEAMSEIFPYNILLVEFLKHQCYEIIENVIYQDDQSAIRIEKKGRKSCSGNSRHILIRYFFIKD